MTAVQRLRRCLTNRLPAKMSRGLCSRPINSTYSPSKCWRVDGVSRAPENGHPRQEQHIGRCINGEHTEPTSIYLHLRITVSVDTTLLPGRKGNERRKSLTLPLQTQLATSGGDTLRSNLQDASHTSTSRIRRTSTSSSASSDASSITLLARLLRLHAAHQYLCTSTSMKSH